MTRYKKDFGETGQDIALEYLQSKGLKLIQSNYQIWGGEVDLVMKEGKTIVFIEVKTRKDNRLEFTELISDAKVHALSRAVQFWLMDNKFENSDFRVDLVGILLKVSKEPNIQWIKSIL